MMSKQATTRGVTNTSRRLRKLPSRKQNHSWNSTSQRSLNTNANGSVTSYMFHADNDGDDMSQFEYSIDPSFAGSKRSLTEVDVDAQQELLPEDWELMSVDESIYWDRSTRQGQPQTQQELEEVWKRTRGMLVKDTSIPKLIVPMTMTVPMTESSRDVRTIHEDGHSNELEDESDEMDLMGSSRNVFQQMQRQQQQQQKQNTKQRPSSTTTRTKLDRNLQVLETHLDITEEESMTNSYGESVTVRSSTAEVEIVAATLEQEHQVKPKKKQKRKSVLNRLFGSFFSSSTKSSKTRTTHKMRQSAPTLSPTDLWNTVDAKSAPNTAMKKRQASTPVKIGPKELWNDPIVERKNNAKQRRRRQSTGTVISHTQPRPAIVSVEC